MKEIFIYKLVFALFLFFGLCIGELLIYPLNKWLFISKKDSFEKYKTIIRGGKAILAVISIYLITTRIFNAVIAGLIAGILVGFISMKTIFPIKYYYLRIRDFFYKGSKTE